MQQRGLLTLPKKLRDALSLEEGQVLRVEQVDGKIFLEPQQSSLDKDLARDIRKGLQDIKAGNFIEFGSISEFHKKLKKYED